MTTDRRPLRREPLTLGPWSPRYRNTQALLASAWQERKRITEHEQARRAWTPRPLVPPS